MESYVKNFIKYKQSDGTKDSTCIIYKRNLEKFDNFLKDKKIELARASKGNIEEYIKHLEEGDFNSSSINQHITSLKNFYTYLENSNNIQNPSRDIPFLKISDNINPLSPSEINLLKNYLESENRIPLRDRLILLLIIQFGFNGQEVCEIKLKNITLEKYYYKIIIGDNVFTIGKNDAKLFTLMEKYLLERTKTEEGALFLTGKNKPLTRPHILYIFQKVSKMLNLSSNSLLAISKAKESAEETIIDKRYRINCLFKSDKLNRVYLVEDLALKNQKKVLKIISLEQNDFSNDYFDQLKGEFSFLSTFTHKNLLRVYEVGFIEETNEIYITREYSAGDSLEKYAGKLTVKDAISVILDLVNGLQYIHSKNFLHYDIKPENISILQEENKMGARYVDMGLAGHITRRLSGVRGTIPFIAPEILANNHSDVRSDIFSLGVTLYFLLSGSLPFKKKDILYINEEPDDLYKIAPLYPKALCDVIMRMIEKKSQARPRDTSSIISQIEGLSTEKDEELIEREIKIDARRGFYTSVEKIIDKFRNRDGEEKIYILTIRGKNNSERNHIASMIKNSLSFATCHYYYLELEKDAPAEKLLSLISSSEKKSQLNVDISRYTPGSLYSENSSNLEEIDPTKKKIDFFEHTWKSLASKSPNVVILNNLENGSNEFNEMVLYILKRIKKTNEQIMVVGLMDPGITQTQNFFSQIGDINFTANEHITFDLNPFSKADVAKLLNKTFSCEVEKGFLDYLYSLTNGNISLFEDIMNLLIKRRLVKLDRINKQICLLNSFPDLLDFDLFKTELFDEESILVLSILSIYGKPIAYNILRSVLIRLKSAASIKEITEKIKILIEKEVIKSSVNGGVSFLTFTSSLFQDEFEKNNKVSQKIEIHGAIAAELEELSLEDESVISDVSHHLLKAKNNERAFIYLISCVHKSETNGLLKDSLNYLNKIDSFIEECPILKKVDYLLLRMKILIELIMLDDAKEICRKLELLKKSLNEEINFHILGARMFSKMGDSIKGLKEIEIALKLATRIPLAPMHFEMILIKASIMITAANFKEAIEIINLYNKMDVDKSMAIYKLKLSNLLAIVYYYSGNYKKAISILDSNILRADEVRDWEIYIHALNISGMIYYQESKFRDSLASYDRAKVILEKRRDPLNMATLLANQAAIYHRVGKFKRAYELYRRAEDIFDEIGEYSGCELVMFGLSLLNLHLGKLNDSILYHEIAQRNSVSHNNVIMIGYVTALLGDIKKCQKDYSEALLEYDKAIDIFEKHGAVKEIFWVIFSKIYILLEFNEIQMARENISKLNLLVKQIFSKDLSARIVLAEIACDIKEKKPDYKRINSKLNELAQDEFIDSEWELKLLTLKEEIKYYISIGDSEKAIGVSQMISDELAKLADGFDDETKNLILNESEYGNLIREITKIGEPKNKLDRLFEISLEITETLNVNRVIEKIIDSSILLSRADRGYVLLLDKDGEPRVKVAKNYTGMHLRREMSTYSKTVVDKAIKNNTPIITENISDEKYLREAKSIQLYKIKSVIAIPLSIRKSVVGVLYIESRTKRGLYTDDDKDTLKLFGNQAAVAIENARIYEELCESKATVEKMNRRLRNKATQIEKKLNETRDYLFIQERSLKYNYDEIIGKSEKIIEVLSLLDKLVDSDLAIFIKGESGTGKELVARAIHCNGKRKDKVFIAENCASFTENLLESALFGHKRGAFTDALTDQMGIFEVADGGTVFLDEIGDMSLSMQKKLLRFLQNGEFRKIGEQKTTYVDVRIISATHRDLKELIKEGLFREDLYYRLNVININLPPLRERIEDIPYLVSYFIDKFNEKTKKNVIVEKEVMDLFLKYIWPGNIRELQNEVNRLIVMREGDTITAQLIRSDPRFLTIERHAH